MTVSYQFYTGPFGMNRARGQALRSQVTRFTLVGAAATCTHYIVAYVFALQISVYSANMAGYLCAVVVSYIGHQRYSFQLQKQEISHKQQLPRFILGSLGGLALSYLVLTIMTDVLHTPDFLSLAAAVGLVPAYTFLINKLYVFQSGPVRK